MKKITIKIDNKEIEAEIKDSDYKDITKSKGKIRPDDGEEYYYNYAGGLVGTSYNARIIDRYMWEVGDGFFTREEAEKELEYRKAKQRVKDYIIENGLEFEPDWEDGDLSKCSIIYNHNSCELQCDYYCRLQRQSTFYFKLFEDAEKVIKDCEKDLLIMFGI